MIIDGFTFFNELELLEIRLMHLWDRVDKFILVEADHTHRGEPKPFVFQEHEKDFAWAASKLVTIQYRFENPLLRGWTLENEQRNAIRLKLGVCSESDILMVSDLDEMPSHSGITRMKDMVSQGKRGLFGFIQKSHHYYLNTSILKPWRGTVASTNPSLVFPQALREFRTFTLNPIPDGGHHFSHLGSVSQISTKLRSTVDSHPTVRLMISSRSVSQAGETFTVEAWSLHHIILF